MVMIALFKFWLDLFCRVQKFLLLQTMDEQSQGMQGPPVPQFQPQVTCSNKPCLETVCVCVCVHVHARSQADTGTVRKEAEPVQFLRNKVLNMLIMSFQA